MTNSPAFSVIIPAYLAAEYIGEAIQSVLNQTFTDFEIIVVNDASPDNTAGVVEGIVDPRIKSIVHEKNRGLPATRNTGIRASSGRYIVFLDHDDVFHPEKLATHLAYLEQHPDVGVTYNSRFETSQSVDCIRRLWIAPPTVALADLVLGYPFSPSDIVLRRECLETIGLLDEGNLFHGEDLNTNCRLALSGCKFAGINRALNYRRNHPARIRKSLDLSLQNVFRNLEVIFSDPRCPADVIVLRDRAYATNYLVWTYMALAQNETELGQGYLRNAIKLYPGIMKDDGRALLEFLILYCVDDERGPLPEAMQNILHQLPPEMRKLSSQTQYALGRAYLLKAIQAMLWGRLAEAGTHFEQAILLKAKMNEYLIQWVTHQLMGYQNEFGAKAVFEVLARLRSHLNQLGARAGDKLTGCYLINDAFADYRAHRYKRVPGLVVQALLTNPIYIFNKGVLSIFARSLVRLVS